MTQLTYTPTSWADEIPASSPVKYQIIDDAHGHLGDSATIVPVTSITHGTPLAANKLNNLEAGIGSLVGAVNKINANLWLTPFNGHPTGSGGCSANTHRVLSAGVSEIDVFEFTTSPTIQSAWWNTIMPDDYDGGAIAAQIYWCHPSTSINFGVSWRVALALSPINAVLNGDAFSEAWARQTGGVANKLYATTPVSLTPNVSRPAGSLLTVTLIRNHTDTPDTLAVAARLIAVKLTYGRLVS